MFSFVVLLTIIGGVLLYTGTAGVLLMFAPKGKKVTAEDVRTEPVSQDLSGLPALSKYKARDGNELEYRYYPVVDFPDKPVFILLHGISTDGKYLHSLALPDNAKRDGACIRP
ncbi:hypothetical protein GK047_21460 [Paenibacillus sp. SYP-B3998]|uniref:Alpha/beta hydrolase n=1 Tax=Paenibacillus sp. SYP-B3998 TaxID=2678564 RepID=A0A6G4A428_9BACL|nr:hypothetical protein [Paenibacillus sp. SYP-B3998]NEW08571.1 hypothetical protein [Paenibacillus sp. SYP-B3998]